MLKLLKARTPSRATHEELFIQRYGQLIGQARQLTASDEQLAEDLVHEAFIQFTLARPELGKIENLDGYLYGMLRKVAYLATAPRHTGSILFHFIG